MYPAQKCVGGTAMSLYPAYLFVLSVPEGKDERKFEKNRRLRRISFHFSWLVQEISRHVCVFLFVFASLPNCAIDFTIVEPLCPLNAPTPPTLLSYGSGLYPACQRRFRRLCAIGWEAWPGAGKDYHIQRNHVPLHVRIQCKTPHSSTISENPVFVNHE